MSSTCPTCGRSGVKLERHHLKTKRVDKTSTELVCVECHRTVHGLFSNQELRDPRNGLDTLEGLLADARFLEALRHVRKLPPGRHMSMKQARQRRRSRR